MPESLPSIPAALSPAERFWAIESGCRRWASIREYTSEAWPLVDTSGGLATSTATWSRCSMRRRKGSDHVRDRQASVRMKSRSSSSPMFP